LLGNKFKGTSESSMAKEGNRMMQIKLHKADFDLIVAAFSYGSKHKDKIDWRIPAYGNQDDLDVLNEKLQSAAEEMGNEEDPVIIELTDSDFINIGCFLSPLIDIYPQSEEASHLEEIYFALSSCEQEQPQTFDLT